MARAVHVGGHATLSARQIAHQISDCQARYVLFSTADQVAKLATVERDLPRGLQFYSYEVTELEINGQPVVPLTELCTAIGKDSAKSIADEALERTKPGDLATILY